MKAKKPTVTIDAEEWHELRKQRDYLANEKVRLGADLLRQERTIGELREELKSGTETNIQLRHSLTVYERHLTMIAHLATIRFPHIPPRPLHGFTTPYFVETELKEA